MLGLLGLGTPAYWDTSLARKNAGTALVEVRKPGPREATSRRAGADPPVGFKPGWTPAGLGLGFGLATGLATKCALRTVHGHGTSKGAAFAVSTQFGQANKNSCAVAARYGGETLRHYAVISRVVWPAMPV